MNTTISVNKSIKQKAALKAKKQGIPFSVVANILFQDFSTGKIKIGTYADEKLSAEEEDELIDILENDDNSPVFSNAEDAISHLHNAK